MKLTPSVSCLYCKKAGAILSEEPHETKEFKKIERWCRSCQRKFIDYEVLEDATSKVLPVQGEEDIPTD